MSKESAGDSVTDRKRVLIVDDHPIVREGLIRHIDRQPGLVVCAEAETPPDALEAIAKHRPDLAVVDLLLRDGSGLELIKDIRAQYPNLPVLVLSMHDESLYAERALRAGARGYIMKQEAADNVIVAIRQVLAGRIYLSDRMASRMLEVAVSGKPEAAASPAERLSDRELEVFEMIGQGIGTREIAEKLRLSVKTVEAHRANIKDKLQLASATELARHAFHWVQSRMG